ncbi:MAG: hypothetical protein HQK86_04340 [Nitrospinae bacterium]|nr:hypothetical protein [Nitrospinota bacterium]
MMKAYCLLLFGILNAGAGYTQKEIVTLVKEHVSIVLSKERVPTKADFNYYEGRCNENEIHMQAIYCILRGWIPTDPGERIDRESYPECLNYEAACREHEDKAPSLYYVWLRKKLPLSPKIKIVNIEHVYHGDYYLVKAKLNKTNVLYNLSSKRDAIADGKVGISQIEGRHASDILDQDDIPNFKKGSLDFLLEAGDLSKYESENDEAPAAR